MIIRARIIGGTLATLTYFLILFISTSIYYTYKSISASKTLFFHTLSLIYFLIAFLAIISNISCMFTDAGKAFSISSLSGSLKCKKCNKLKSRKMHHCSRCNQCIYKMDHHCY